MNGLVQLVWSVDILQQTCYQQANMACGSLLTMLHESYWELTTESLYERFLNSHVPVKREQELHESCMRVHKREFE